jgi:hypothetical protein
VPDIRCLECRHIEGDHVTAPVHVHAEGFADMRVMGVIDEGACLHLDGLNNRGRPCTCRRFIPDFQQATA